MGVEVPVGETPSLTGEFVGETPQGPRACTSPPTRESAPEGPSLIVGSGVTEIQQRVEQVALLPIRPLSHKQCHRAATNVTLPR